MAIKITLSDAITDAELEQFIVSDIDIKVLSTGMRPHDKDEGSPVVFISWIKNALFEKIRRERDFLVEKALGGGHKKIESLKDTDKQLIMSELNAGGYVALQSIKEIPDVIKDSIIELAKIKTAEERYIELMAEFEGD